MRQLDEKEFIDALEFNDELPTNVIKLPLKVYMSYSVLGALDIHFNNLASYYTEEELLVYIANRYGLVKP